MKTKNIGKEPSPPPPQDSQRLVLPWDTQKFSGDQDFLEEILETLSRSLPGINVFWSTPSPKIANACIQVAQNLLDLLDEGGIPSLVVVSDSQKFLSAASSIIPAILALTRLFVPACVSTRDILEHFRLSRSPFRSSQQQEDDSASLMAPFVGQPDYLERVGVLAWKGLTDSCLGGTLKNEALFLGLLEARRTFRRPTLLLTFSNQLTRDGIDRIKARVQELFGEKVLDELEELDFRLFSLPKRPAGVFLQDLGE